MLNIKNSKTVATVTSIFFITVTLVLFNSGCSSRNEPPMLSEDSTLVYIPKNPADITANITFCNRISRKTGEPIGAGTIFSIKDKAKVYAMVDLKNREFHTSKDLMFHIDWIEPNGSSLYKRRIDMLPGDSSSTITSSISTSPDKRQPGNYLFRVYLFRELIAEKKFVLISAAEDSIEANSMKTAESTKANITFGRKVNTKTGELRLACLLDFGLSD